MSSSTLRAKMLEEVNSIPEDKLLELYDVIRYFGLGLEASQGGVQQIMQFAGCWKDMPEELFAEFSEEIVKRRRQAFSMNPMLSKGADLEKPDTMAGSQARGIR